MYWHDTPQVPTTFNYNDVQSNAVQLKYNLFLEFDLTFTF